VEDDSRIQQLISAEITDEGHACICFGSAEDFLDEAGSDRFDLLLGLDAARHGRLGLPETAAAPGCFPACVGRTDVSVSLGVALG